MVVELLTGDEGVGYAAQRWHQIFEKLQIELLVRRADAGEAIETIEEAGSSVGGTARKVRARGKLEKSGQLTFSDRSFSESQAGQLARWLRDLQEFGAQGSPKGQPVWGLNKVQFNGLFAALSEPVTGETEEKTLSEAVAALNMPDRFPLSYSKDADRVRLSNADSARAGAEEPTGEIKTRQSVAGVAKGTALAAVLSEFGLGFRPRRLADGKVDLQICTQSESSDLWPIGWPQQASNPKTAPKYFALLKIDLQDVMLDEVLEAASSRMSMPILVDYYALTAKKIDLSKVKVAHPAKQTTWSLALQQLTFQGKAQAHLYIDESGKPLVWVTPLGTVRKARASATN